MITLKTLEQATAQEIFDQVAAHLIRQGRVSFSVERAACVYRHADGRKCAAGCLIGDDEYIEDFEGKSWNVLAKEEVVPKFHEHLIYGLQQIHDMQNKTFEVVDWIPLLQRFAKENDLAFDPSKYQSPS